MRKNTAQPRANPPADDAGKAERVLSKAVLRAAEHLGLSHGALARVLGLSGPSITRLKQGSFLLRRGSKEFELGQLFVRLFRGLDAITGGDDRSSRSWLATDNLALGGRPAAMIETIPGLMAAIQYVDQRRARL